MADCAEILATYLCERTGYRTCPQADPWPLFVSYTFERLCHRSRP